MNRIYGFSPPFVLYFPSVFLLTLIWCLGDVGSSSLLKVKRGKQKSFALCAMFKLERFAHSPLPCTLSSEHSPLNIVRIFFSSPPSLHSPPQPCLPTATVSIIFHLTDQPHPLAETPASSHFKPPGS